MHLKSVHQSLMDKMKNGNKRHLINCVFVELHFYSFASLSLTYSPPKMKEHLTISRGDVTPNVLCPFFGEIEKVILQSNNTLHGPSPIHNCAICIEFREMIFRVVFLHLILSIFFIKASLPFFYTINHFVSHRELLNIRMQQKTRNHFKLSIFLSNFI